MHIEPGKTLLHYRIDAKIGEGGMGEVWRSTDTSLNREVAIKVLPGDVASSPNGLARFEREAKLLATLNHPNVATVYGFHQADGVSFLAMELVEGEDLAERLARGPLSIVNALETAHKIAIGLTAAHDKGVVHRDLKPANVKRASDGTVKVLDFGLAKSFDGGGDGRSASGSVSVSPTMTSAGSVAGMIVGTAAYMSPEQARGKPVDARSDVWAFGCMLYEMLTGRRLFEGETVSDILAEVLKTDPDWSTLPPATPPAARRLLARCLQRDPQRRLHHMADARLEIEEALAEPSPSAADGGAGVAGVPAPASSRGRLAVAVVGAAIVGVALGWVALGQLRGTQPPPQTVRADVLPPQGTRLDLDSQPSPGILSPDGSKLVFGILEPESEIEQLHVHNLADGSAVGLEGTEGAQYPFWSPDSQWIGYFQSPESGGVLKKIRAEGGPPTVVCATLNGKGGTWSEDGTILFAPSFGSPIYRVDAAGGESVAVTTLDNAFHNSHRHPRFLADGDHFLFLARGTAEGHNAVMVGSLATGEAVELMPTVTQAEPAGDHLLFAQDDAILARPFDLGRLAFTGEARIVASGVTTVGGAAYAAFSVGGGHLAYSVGETETPGVLRWRDRAGNVLETLGDPAFFQGIELSPDGRVAALVVLGEAGGSFEIWTLDLERGVRTRLVKEAGDQFAPVWSADGTTVYFASNHERGLFSIYRKRPGSVAPAEKVLELETNAHPMAMTPDGRWLIYKVQDVDAVDLWKLDLSDESGKREPVLNGPHREVRARVSPDGRHLAYVSDESGREEVYVATFPALDRRWQVSGAGGTVPEWIRDTGELLFKTADDEVVVSRIRERGGDLEVGAPQPVFTEPVRRNVLRDSTLVAPAPDGRRFLTVDYEAPSEESRVRLVLNWRQAP